MAAVVLGEPVEDLLDATYFAFHHHSHCCTNKKDTSKNVVESQVDFVHPRSPRRSTSSVRVSTVG